MSSCIIFFGTITLVLLALANIWRKQVTKVKTSKKEQYITHSRSQWSNIQVNKLAIAHWIIIRRLQPIILLPFINP